MLGSPPSRQVFSFKTPASSPFFTFKPPRAIFPSPRGAPASSAPLAPRPGRLRSHDAGSVPRARFSPACAYLFLSRGYAVGAGEGGPCAPALSGAGEMMRDAGLGSCRHSLENQQPKDPPFDRNPRRQSCPDRRGSPTRKTDVRTDGREAQAPSPPRGASRHTFLKFRAEELLKRE